MNKISTPNCNIIYNQHMQILAYSVQPLSMRAKRAKDQFCVQSCIPFWEIIIYLYFVKQNEY